MEVPVKGTKGTIEEVSTNGEMCEYKITIGKDGIEDDKSGTPGVLIQNAEVPHFLNKEFQMEIQAGQLGENILARDLTNLSELTQGTRIRIMSQRINKVPNPNVPNAMLTLVTPALVILQVESRPDHYRARFSKIYPEPVLAHLEAHCGAICSVIEGVGVQIAYDQEIEILLAEELKGAA